MSRHVELTKDGFDPAARLATFSASLGDEGAVVSFTGRARGKAKDGNAVGALEGVDQHAGQHLGERVDAELRYYRVKPSSLSRPPHRTGGRHSKRRII